MGNSGPDNKSVVKAFVAIVTDSKARTSLRCDLAQYLGQSQVSGRQQNELASTSQRGRRRWWSTFASRELRAGEELESRRVEAAG